MDLQASDVLPEKVLSRRLVKKGNAAVLQVLIKWSNIPEASATWEDFYVIKDRFPTALAWGQAMSQGGEDVMAGA